MHWREKNTSLNCIFKGRNNLHTDADTCICTLKHHMKRTNNFSMKS